MILAEGVPAETFVDDDSRALFDNVSEYYDLYGIAESQSWLRAPRLEEGYRLEAIRRRIAARAGSPPAAVPGALAGHVERLDDGELQGLGDGSGPIRRRRWNWKCWSTARSSPPCWPTATGWTSTAPASPVAVAPSPWRCRPRPRDIAPGRGAARQRRRAGGHADSARSSPPELTGLRASPCDAERPPPAPSGRRFLCGAGLRQPIPALPAQHRFHRGSIMAEQVAQVTRDRQPACHPDPHFADDVRLHRSGRGSMPRNAQIRSSWRCGSARKSRSSRRAAVHR